MGFEQFHSGINKKQVFIKGEDNEENYRVDNGINDYARISWRMLGRVG